MSADSYADRHTDQYPHADFYGYQHAGRHGDAVGHANEFPDRYVNQHRNADLNEHHDTDSSFLQGRRAR